jgi:hypothetical protein
MAGLPTLNRPIEVRPLGEQRSTMDLWLIGGATG